MKTILRQSIYWVVALICINMSMPLMATDSPKKPIVVSGIIKDNQSKRPLGSVNITVPGTNIGTVSNADGRFIIKIPVAYKDKSLEVSHVGYLNRQLPLSVANLSDVTIWLKQYSNTLNEIIVYPIDPRQLIEDVIRKIPTNYSNLSNMLTAFYRETVQKRNNYISISEAVIDIYKTAYDTRIIEKDKVEILRGRRLLSQRSSDTLSVKLAGGPYLSIFLDIIKNKNLLLNSNDLIFYDFWMEEPVSIDNRLQLVVGFEPRFEADISLLKGKLFIDRERLALSRAEFNLDMRNKNKVIETILLKKPLGLRFHPQEMSYVVTYNEINGKSYLSYINNTIRFKCDWKRKLFSTAFKVNTEMVITDRTADDIKPISRKDAFGSREVFYDNVFSYWDKDYWEDYNIIEPTESLENAAARLKKSNESSMK